VYKIAHSPLLIFFKINMISKRCNFWSVRNKTWKYTLTKFTLTVCPSFCLSEQKKTLLQLSGSLYKKIFGNFTKIFGYILTFVNVWQNNENIRFRRHMKLNSLNTYPTEIFVVIKRHAHMWLTFYNQFTISIKKGNEEREAKHQNPYATNAVLNLF
jgi:hypothetical protein